MLAGSSVTCAEGSTRETDLWLFKQHQAFPWAIQSSLCPSCVEKTAPAVQSPALASPLTGFMTLAAANSSRLDAAHFSFLTAQMFKAKLGSSQDHVLGISTTLVLEDNLYSWAELALGRLAININKLLFQPWHQPEGSRINIYLCC